MRSALLTYNMAAEWDLDTLLEKCATLGFEGVELRTDREHAHGIEVEIGAAEREAARRKFADAGVEIAGLSSGCAFDATDPDELAWNLTRAKAHLDLAADLDAGGVKVFGNKAHVNEGVPLEQTVAQIGRALADGDMRRARCAGAVRDARGFTAPEVCNEIMARAGDGPGICLIYNCNNEFDVDSNGSVATSYRAVAPRIGHVHIHDLADPDFPYLELMRLLVADGYDGWCSSELQDSPDRERVLRFQVALWRAYLAMAQSA